MSIEIIPIDNSQVVFKQLMTLNNVVVNFRFYFNSRSQRWKMDMLDQDNSPIILGRTINLGLDLMGRHQDERLPEGFLNTFDLKDLDTEANLDNFGADVLMVFDTEEEDG